MAIRQIYILCDNFKMVGEDLTWSLLLSNIGSFLSGILLADIVTSDHPLMFEASKYFFMFKFNNISHKITRATMLDREETRLILEKFLDITKWLTVDLSWQSSSFLLFYSSSGLSFVLMVITIIFFLATIVVVIPRLSLIVKKPSSSPKPNLPLVVVMNLHVN